LRFGAAETSITRPRLFGPVSGADDAAGGVDGQGSSNTAAASLEPPDWVTLTQGEEVVWGGRPTLLAYTSGVVGGLVLAGLGVAVWLVAGRGAVAGVEIPPDLPGGIVGAALVVLGLYRVARALVDWWTVRYLITTEEVYKKQGVVSRTVRNLRLDRVQNTSFSQSVTGRLFSHGNVRVETAGGGGAALVFRHVPDPETVLGHLTRALDRRRDRESP